LVLTKVTRPTIQQVEWMIFAKNGAGTTEYQQAKQ
jgi:hypothetical protein